VTRKDLRLPIERQMISVFAHHHVGHEGKRTFIVSDKRSLVGSQPSISRAGAGA
jgi:hypothetical protein